MERPLLVLYLSLAYKYVATALMLAEINFCSERLHLPTPLPVQPAHVRETYVGPPRLVHSLGSVDTRQYSYGFGESGRLRFITRLDAFEKQSLRELHLKLANSPAGISTNQAYDLATNWLTAIQVDVVALETKHRPIVQQRFFYGGSDGQSQQGIQKIFIPIFDVTWGRGETPAITVSVYGHTKELLQLRQDDESFSRRPIRGIDNVEELLAIPDPDFLQWNALQRSNLVVSFAKPKL